ncbi:MAG TPA: SRPBCC domain-containing protein [Chryseosolibacter sp.]
MNPSSTWNEFSIQIPVGAGISDLYAAWATQAGIEKWFLRSAIFKTPQGSLRGPNEPVQKGDRYRWLWHGYPDHVMEANEVLAANGIDLFQFEFTGKCIVTVKLEKVKAFTMVKLKQDRIPDDPNPSTNLFVGCQLGWTFYLANLKSIFEGGIDLRNRDLDLKNVVNA